MTADKIAAARALIEPLTGHTPGPWAQEHRYNRRTGDGYSTQVFPPDDSGNTICTLDWHTVSNERGGFHTDREYNARIIAAAPDLRDTVAALADLADAQAQLIAARGEAIDRLFEALAWLDTFSPEDVAAAEAKFGIHVQTGTVIRRAATGDTQ